MSERVFPVWAVTHYSTLFCGFPDATEFVLKKDGMI